MTQTKAELLQTRHQGDLKLGDADSSHYVGFKAPATVSSSLVWILPAADGSSNQFLKTDGSGNLSWATDSATDSSKMPLAGGIFTGDVTFDGATAGRDIVFDRSDNALEFADNAKVIFGTSSDLQLFHDGSHSYIKDGGTGSLILLGDDVLIKNTAETENKARFHSNGSVELFHNNVKTFETEDNGAYIYGPEGGIAQLMLYADEGDDNPDKWRMAASASASQFNLYNFNDGGWETSLQCIGSGAVELYFNNSKKLETLNGGGKLSGQWNADGLDLDDNDKLYFGTGNDLQIYHNGSNSFIKNTTGTLQITADAAEFVNADNSEYKARYINNGAVELYYNGVKKIETTAQAVKLTGGIAQVVTAAGALELDLNTSNYFTKTISGNSTFTFANPAASGQVTAFTLELTHSSGTVTWPSSVKWNADTAPTLTTGKTHLFMFVTDDGGTRYRGSALVDYVN